MSMVEAGRLLHFDQVFLSQGLVENRNRPLKQIMRWIDAERARMKDYRLSPEVHKINPEPIRAFANLLAGPGCEHTQVVFIAQTHRRSFYLDMGLGETDTDHVGGLYLQSINTAVVFYDANYQRLDHECCLLEEFTHATTRKVLSIKRINALDDIEFRVPRDGLCVENVRDKSELSWGKFLEEGFVGMVKLKYLELRRRMNHGHGDGVMSEMNVDIDPDEILLVMDGDSGGIGIPRKYYYLAERDHLRLTASLSLIAAAGLELLQQRRPEFFWLLRWARRDWRQIKKVAGVIDSVLGRGSYAYLQQRQESLHGVIEGCVYIAERLDNS